jgi:hypothetical protein
MGAGSQGAPSAPPFPPPASYPPSEHPGTDNYSAAQPERYPPPQTSAYAPPQSTAYPPPPPASGPVAPPPPPAAAPYAAAPPPSGTAWCARDTLAGSSSAAMPAANVPHRPTGFAGFAPSAPAPLPGLPVRSPRVRLGFASPKPLPLLAAGTSSIGVKQLRPAAPQIPPQPGQVVVGYEVFKPEPGCFRCGGLSPAGLLAGGCRASG